MYNRPGLFFRSNIIVLLAIFVGCGVVLSTVVQAQDEFYNNPRIQKLYDFNPNEVHFSLYHGFYVSPATGRNVIRADHLRRTFSDEIYHLYLGDPLVDQGFSGFGHRIELMLSLGYPTERQSVDFIEEDDLTASALDDDRYRLSGPLFLMSIGKSW